MLRRVIRDDFIFDLLYLPLHFNFLTSKFWPLLLDPWEIYTRNHRHFQQLLITISPRAHSGCFFKMIQLRLVLKGTGLLHSRSLSRILFFPWIHLHIFPNAYSAWNYCGERARGRWRATHQCKVWYHSQNRKQTHRRESIHQKWPREICSNSSAQTRKAKWAACIFLF